MGGGAEIVCVCSGTFRTLAKRNKTIKWTPSQPG